MLFGESESARESVCVCVCVCVCHERGASSGGRFTSANSQLPAGRALCRTIWPRCLSWLLLVL